MLNLDTNVFLAVVEEALRQDELRAMRHDDHWCISAIVLWEIAKLNQLHRIKLAVNDPIVLQLLELVEIVPIDIEIAKASARRDFRSDPADEIIAATSIVHNAPLVTRDSTILRSLLVPLATK